MLPVGTKCKLARVPLARIVVCDATPGYHKPVKRYLRLLKRNPRADLDFLRLAPLADAPGYGRVLDGRHRLCAYWLAARHDAPALLEWEPDWPGYDTLDDSWQAV